MCEHGGEEKMEREENGETVRERETSEVVERGGERG